MSGRDPFPMQSEEARRLEASVANTQGSSWNTMGTSIDVSNERVNDETGSIEAEASLVAKVNSTKKNDPEASIYDDMDTQTKAEKYLENEDDYLDNPMASSSSSGACSSGFMYKVKKNLLILHRYLYGDKLPPSETIRTLCLSSTLFFMIGGYWLLRSLKDPVLTALCGVTAIPKAKMLSVAVVLFVVSIYNRLLDNPNLSKHTLFYIFGMFYFVLFSIISVLLTHPTIGLPNETPSYSRILGWVSYCSIESFGSVMVSLFWSFANSNFNLESAKASYGLLVATAQIGSILGPTIVNVYAETLGVAKIYAFGALAMLLLQGAMFLYIKIYGTDETRAKEQDADTQPKKKKKGAGVLEGLHLFAKHNYVKGIFAISCLFMVEVTIVDYTMKVLAKDHFSGLYPCTAGNSCWDVVKNEPRGMSAEATAAFTTFMGLFGQATNTLSFLLSFLGTSAIIRKLGLRLTLLLFPSLCLIVIIIVRLHPTLYVVFAAMMVLKANSYALNNPTKEMLYQPTSSAVRYKAKSWIDIFGARGSKALGSLVTNAFSDSASHLVANGSLVGMCVASFLIWNARFMGRSFDEYVKTGYIVGGEDDAQNTNGDHIELATEQNDCSDTSCGIYDDDDIKENVSDHSDPNDDDDSNDDGEKADNDKPKTELV
ncbi:hypothetical protein CTEN210_07338 [Chaetoceros tenuissimus]|uniref:ADP,ATP carrier protein n=1 Tax=Chaetoceros tenuissimus TaxID=426638 RepID=A0AAD3CRI7_9STRA|nr:hypothetical protein CTEN210_07338 [Chaetoceros tenuissimus]